MAKPQFTCLMTCYEQEQYIYEALDSLLAQDYENIQLILVDDGSKVFHEGSVRQYIEEHKGSNITSVIVEVNSENMGAIRTYNKALPWVTGKYVHIFDGDDVYYDASTVRKIVNNFESLSDTECILASQMLMCSERCEEPLSLYCDVSLMEQMNAMTAQEQFEKCCESVYYPKGSVVFRTSLFQKEGGYDESFLVIDDWPTFLRMTHRGYKIWYFDFVTCRHRFGGISTNTKMSPRKVRYLCELVKVQEKYVLPYMNEFSLRNQLKIFGNYKNCIFNEHAAMGINDFHINARFFCKYSKAYSRYYCLTLITRLIELMAHYGLHVTKTFVLGTIAFLAFSWLSPISALSMIAAIFAKGTAIMALVASWCTVGCRLLKFLPLPH